MNNGSPLYRPRFQWQPTRTAHDPANTLTLEDGVAAATYTFTGAVALAFTVASPQTFTAAPAASVALTLVVASPQTFTDVQPVDVALTFAVSSPVAVTYAEPASIALVFGVAADVDFGDVQAADVALTFGVAAPQSFTATVVAGVALTFGVASPFEYVPGTTVYEVTGDVALTFGVESGFEYVAGEHAAPVTGGFGGSLWGKKSRPLKLRPQTYAFTGNVRFAPGWEPRSPWSVTFARTGSGTMPRIVPESPHSVTHTEPVSAAMAKMGKPASPMAFSVSPQLDEWLIIDPDDWLGAILNEEELALGGVP